MKKIALIPARGGSKRIKHKNIIDFCGAPMISYPIRVAQDSQVFDDIIISTDDEMIADIARQYGARVPFVRPSSLSDDFTPTIPVIQHAIKELNLESSDLLCAIYPTTPLLRVDSIKKGLDILLSNPKIHYAFCAVAYDYNPLRSFYMRDDNISMLFPKHLNTRSQDLESVFHDAGQFYWGRVQAWSDGKAIFGGDSKAIIVESLQTQDIDTYKDLALAEIKYRLARDMD